MIVTGHEYVEHAVFADGARATSTISSPNPAAKAPLRRLAWGRSKSPIVSQCDHGGAVGGPHDPQSSCVSSGTQSRRGIAQQGYLVTLGIGRASHIPATDTSNAAEHGPFPGLSKRTRSHVSSKSQIIRLLERYMAEGNYSWNAGIFVWRVDVILAAIKRTSGFVHTIARDRSSRWTKPAASVRRYMGRCRQHHNRLWHDGACIQGGDHSGRYWLERCWRLGYLDWLSPGSQR